MTETVLIGISSSAVALLLARIVWAMLDKRLTALETDHVGKGWVDRRSQSVDKQLDLKENREACEINRANISERLCRLEERAEQNRIENKDEHRNIMMAMDSFTSELAKNTKCLTLLAEGVKCE